MRTAIGFIFAAAIGACSRETGEHLERGDRGAAAEVEAEARVIGEGVADTVERADEAGDRAEAEAERR